MWILKLISNEGVETLHECSHFEVTRILPGSAIANIVAKAQGLAPDSTEHLGIEIRYVKDGVTKLLRVPQDGRVVYVLNSVGKAIDGYRYPPRARK